MTRATRRRRTPRPPPRPPPTPPPRRGKRVFSFKVFVFSSPFVAFRERSREAARERAELPGASVVIRCGVTSGPIERAFGGEAVA